MSLLVGMLTATSDYIYDKQNIRHTVTALLQFEVNSIGHPFFFTLMLQCVEGSKAFSKGDQKLREFNLRTLAGGMDKRLDS